MPTRHFKLTLRRSTICWTKGSKFGLNKQFVSLDKAMSSNFQPERLTEARQSKGLNMTDLANLVGVTRQAISAFEKGIDAPSSETLLRLSNVLSMPREFFTLE